MDRKDRMKQKRHFSFFPSLPSRHSFHCVSLSSISNKTTFCVECCAKRQQQNNCKNKLLLFDVTYNAQVVLSEMECTRHGIVQEPNKKKLHKGTKTQKRASRQEKRKKKRRQEYNRQEAVISLITANLIVFLITAILIVFLAVAVLIVFLAVAVVIWSSSAYSSLLLLLLA
jgi:cation transport ATPase